MDLDHRNSIPHQCGDHIHRHRCNTSDFLLSTALNSLNLSCNIAKVRICHRITTIVRSSSNMRCLDQKGTVEGYTRRRRCTRHPHRRRQDLGRRDIQDGQFSNHSLITSGPLMTFCVILHPIDRSSSSSRSHHRRITLTVVEDLCKERSKKVYLQFCDVSLFVAMTSCE